MRSAPSVRVAVCQHCFSGRHEQCVGPADCTCRSCGATGEVSRSYEIRADAPEGVSAPAAAKRGAFAGLLDPRFMDLRINGGHLRTGLRKADGGPLAGAHASVETGADASRYTATRLAALGLLGLAFKKSKQQTFLTVVGDGWALVREVDKKEQLAARAFAAKINAAAAAA